MGLTEKTIGQASSYLLEPAVNEVLCGLCYKQKKLKGLQNGTNWREKEQITQVRFRSIKLTASDCD